MRRFLTVTVAVGVVMLASTPTAHATFAGHDGLLAVQPVQGSGVLLVRPSGRVVRDLCVNFQGECSTGRPSFSPDGRDLAVDGLTQAVVDLQDNCVNCDIELPTGELRGDLGLSFKPKHEGLAYLDDTSLIGIGLDGYYTRQLKLKLPAIYGGLTSQDWASNGAVAVSSQGEVFITTAAGKVKHLGRGSDPSLAPDGGRVAVERVGWIWVLSSATGHEHRLVPGSEPTFSPDGQKLAFITPTHRVAVIDVTGGSARTVGTITGQSVAWQPAPTGQARCVMPSDATAIGSSEGTEIDSVSESRGPTRIYGTESEIVGCTNASGQLRVLADTTDTGEDVSSLDQISVNGHYAAFVFDDQDLHYGGSSEDAVVDNVATGQTVQRPSACLDGCTPEAVVVAPDGSAAFLDSFHDSCPNDSGGPPDCVYDEVVQAVHSQTTPLDITVADTTTGTTLTPLTDLAINGQTLTWLHGGTAMSATLR